MAQLRLRRRRGTLLPRSIRHSKSESVPVRFTPLHGIGWQPRQTAFFSLTTRQIVYSNARSMLMEFARHEASRSVVIEQKSSDYF
jgi:hypothetical protein